MTAVCSTTTSPPRQGKSFLFCPLVCSKGRQIPASSRTNQGGCKGRFIPLWGLLEECVVCGGAYAGAAVKRVLETTLPRAVYIFEKVRVHRRRSVPASFANQLAVKVRLHEGATSERRGNNLKRFEDFHQTAKARIQLWLSHVCQIRWTAVCRRLSVFSATLFCSCLQLWGSDLRSQF